MILVFDVGNSETTLALFDGDVVHAHWRIVTGVERTVDEYGMLLRSLIQSADITRVDGVAIGSVVPRVTEPLRAACAQWLEVEPLIVDASSPLPVKLDVDEPLTVGADRVINTLAASRLYQQDTIVVDLGTATTFDCITAQGVFLGGAIAPGVRTAAESLVRKTAKLPATELVAPSRVIGRRTEECIQAGVVIGAAEAIDGLVRRIREEWPNKSRPMCVATGGLAQIFAKLCKSFDRVEPHLTLLGLHMAWDLLGAPGGSQRATVKASSTAPGRRRRS